MPETTERQSNRAPWAALALALAALLSNAVFFLALPGQRFVPWVEVGVIVAALSWAALGVKRAFLQPQMYGGKVGSSILGLVAVAICAFTMFGFFHARELPASAGAPKVGEKASDFTLADTNGNKVSLGQLLGRAEAGSASPATANNVGSATPPKAVLLVFYRGYW
ncbi:MAG: hypothetical protein WA738_09870 [Candidatus Angelobacter sp.]